MAKRLNIEDYRGKKYGKLTILDFYKKKSYIYVICKCDCGNIYHTRLSSILDNKTKSCGCLQKEIIGNLNKTHGLKDSHIYKVWTSMKQRCYNPKRKGYQNYGGRGIIVCKEWKDNFLTFYDWAITNGYKEGLSIDRIDNNGNYEPLNCRWTNAIHQIHNRRINKNNKSGIVGVYKHTINNRWCSYIWQGTKQIYLGSFKNLEEATRARKEAEKLYYEPLLSMN